MCRLSCRSRNANLHSRLSQALLSVLLYTQGRHKSVCGKMVSRSLSVNTPIFTPLPHPTQTQGLGTALKILFSEKEIQNLPENSPSKGFQLTRQEIVALLNAFGR